MSEIGSIPAHIYRSENSTGCSTGLLGPRISELSKPLMLFVPPKRNLELVGIRL